MVAFKQVPPDDTYKIAQTHTQRPTTQVNRVSFFGGHNVGPLRISVISHQGAFDVSCEKAWHVLLPFCCAKHGHNTSMTDTGLVVRLVSVLQPTFIEKVHTHTVFYSSNEPIPQYQNILVDSPRAPVENGHPPCGSQQLLDQNLGVPQNLAISVLTYSHSCFYYQVPCPSLIDMHLKYAKNSSPALSQVAVAFTGAFSMVLGNFADSHLPVSFLGNWHWKSNDALPFLSVKESMSQEQNFEEAWSNL